jgi:bifunctional non-homologous end joining protein LigD
MVEVSNADRIVFPEVKRTKGDVVRYYESIAPRALPHIIGRPLSMKRFPKGLAAPGFFQKNVPPHYPASIERFAVPRSRAASKKHPRKGAGAGADEADVTTYPVLRAAEHLPYVANQGAIELHVPTARVPDLFHPDRLVVDLDPPANALDLVRRAAQHVRAMLEELGLPSIPVATGSKGYHIVGAVTPAASADIVAGAMQKLAALLASEHPEELTIAFRVAQRGRRVFVDWLRNNPMATVVAPYSLRARPRATIAAPIAWKELEATAPDAFTIDDAQALLDRPDALAALAASPTDPRKFIEAVDARFEKAGLVLETFDRFRS